MSAASWIHPTISRRTTVQAGAIGLLGMGMNHLAGLRSANAAAPVSNAAGAKSCIYIFLSGGLAQQDSFDLKPNAPAEIRGEFNPIATNTPGIDICEHLPMLAQRSHLWSLVRSLTHPTNGHTLGHYYMLTGHSTAPGFKGDRLPRPTDWPAISSIVGDAVPAQQNNLPPAVMLPERLVHWSGGVIPGAYGGTMGHHRDPFIIGATQYGDPFWRGAYPEYTFHQLPKKTPTSDTPTVFQAPNLKLQSGITGTRFDKRLNLLNSIDAQRAALEASATGELYDQHRQSAVSLLASQKIRRAIDVNQADEKTQERYGRNTFGWSLLMAYRMAEAGVPMIQVNLGNNEAWDTHGEAFWRLREKLLPPTDRALSALLDDLGQSGLLDSTMIVMGGEFGRTPKISLLEKEYKEPGRDHWGAVQTLFFAGGGVRGGNVIGSSDEQAAYPASDPQKPENMAASIYNALGIPRTATWKDELDRPHNIYFGDPIEGLV